MKLNLEKNIRAEIARLDKEIKIGDAGGSRGGLQHYREGYRDALVRILVDVDFKSEVFADAIRLLV